MMEHNCFTILERKKFLIKVCEALTERLMHFSFCHQPDYPACIIFPFTLGQQFIILWLGPSVII